VLLAASLALFCWIVPHAVAEVTAGRTLAPKILDEYYPTWTADDARRLYAALGVRGRQAYRAYYLHLDFWFPMLTLSLFYVSLLSLAFKPSSRWSWLNLLPIAMWVSDVAENLNHFSMAGSYPMLSSFSLTWGPLFSASKYGLMTVLLLPTVAVFVSKVFRRRRLAGATS
jgi:hypothetical protein